MTPAQQAKAAGLKSLTQVSNETGVSLNTLTNWHRDKPELFKTVLAGVKALKPKPSGELTYDQIKAIIEDGEYWGCGANPHSWDTINKIRFCSDAEEITSSGSELDLKIIDAMRDDFIGSVRSYIAHGRSHKFYMGEYIAVIMSERVCDIIEEIIEEIVDR